MIGSSCFALQVPDVRGLHAGPGATICFFHAQISLTQGNTIDTVGAVVTGCCKNAAKRLTHVHIGYTRSWSHSIPSHLVSGNARYRPYAITPQNQVHVMQAAMNLSACDAGSHFEWKE